MSIWKQMVQMDFFFIIIIILASPLQKYTGSTFYWERFRWKFSPDGPSEMEKLFCFASGGHSSPASCVLPALFLINISFSTSTPITVSPTPRRTRCPVCRSLFPKMERSSSRLRCPLMIVARLGWASASKETSPGRRGRTWGSSSNPLSMVELRTRWWNILRHIQMSNDKHSGQLRKDDWEM